MATDRTATTPGTGIQAAPVPAPAFEIKKRRYKTGSVIELELTTTFTGADGMTTTMSRSYRIFARECS